MIGKKSSSYVGFNPFSKYPKEKSSISTKIINKLKSFFQINLNPSSCIQREFISQQTIYVPVNSEIIGAQIIEQDSIQICPSQSSQRQKRNKFTSFDDHLKEQQSIIELQNDQLSKIQQKEEKYLRKLNLQEQKFDPVLPIDIDNAEIKENKIIYPRRKLSSQKYKKRKLDEKKKTLGIKFVPKKHVYDQIQDSINESRIQEVQEQLSDDSLKNNSLLGVGPKDEPQKKEIIVIQLKEEKPVQPEPPMLSINEFIEHQQKGLKKSQSMINLNEQEARSFSCSPKKFEIPQSRKQSDAINKLNEPKQFENQKEQVIDQVERKQDDNKTETSLQPQQNIINFLVQGSQKQDKSSIHSNNTIFNQLKQDGNEEKKTLEQQEKNFNNFSDTPLFGFGKTSEGLQGQIPQSKINVQSSLFASFDSKELNKQQSSDQSSGQNLLQNQFTFLQNKPNAIETLQQTSNSESSNSNVNNKKDSTDQQQLKNEQNNQTYSHFNNTQSTQNEQFNTNEQFRTKKHLFQNLVSVNHNLQGENIEEKKQDQQVENNEIQKQSEIQKQIGLFSGFNFQNQSEKNNNIITQKEQEPSIPLFQSFQFKQVNENNKQENKSVGLFGDILIKQTEKDNQNVKGEQSLFFNNIITNSQNNYNKDINNELNKFEQNNLFNFENKNTINTPRDQDNQSQQNYSQKPEILTPLNNSIGLNCQWKSSSADQKNNQFNNNNNSEPKQDDQLKQSPFAFFSKQVPQSANDKSDILSSDQIVKSVTTPRKQVENPFLQQSPKINQEQINSYFSNKSQENGIHKDSPIKVQTSLFENDLFKQQNNVPSLFTNLPFKQMQQVEPVQNSLFQFQQNPPQNIFEQQSVLFQTNTNYEMNTNNNGNNNQMEITDVNQTTEQSQITQQQSQPLNSFEPNMQTNNFLSQPSMTGSFNNSGQTFQQQQDLPISLFQFPVNQQQISLFDQDPQKLTNQPQSLNSSFQGKSSSKKLRI